MTDGRRAKVDPSSTSRPRHDSGPPGSARGLQDDNRRAHLFGARGAQAFGPDDDLTFPEVVPGFVVAVRRFFE
jgi:hypothetical protein